MEIEQSSLWREIRQIVTSGEKPVHSSWTAELHVGDRETVVPLRITSIDFKNDYLNNYAIELHVTMDILLGTYVKRIYPYLNELDITLSNVPISEVVDANNENLAPSSERYTAIILDTGNPTFEMNTRVNVSEDT